MRVLMTNWLYLPEFSGAALQCHRLSLKLTKMGVDVHVLAGVHDEKAMNINNVDGIHIKRIIRNKNKMRTHLSYAWNMFHYIVRHSKQFDLLHTHGFHAPANLAAKATGLPIIQKITNLNVDDPVAVKKRRNGSWLMPVYECADVVVPTSKLLNEKCDNTVQSKTMIEQIPNGVDIDLFFPVSAAEKAKLRKKFAISDETIALLTVGTVSYKKGLDTLIKALYRLRLSLKKKIILWSVGPHDFECENGQTDYSTVRFASMMRKMAVDYGLANIIRFEGLRPNVADYIKAADIYIHPSRQEGQPNALLEAMACGLPTVANSIPGITDDIVQNGKFGFLVNCEDTEVFAAALRVLINNGSLRSRLGSNARKEILDQYDLNLVANQYAALYERIIGLNESSKKIRRSNARHTSILNSLKNSIDHYIGKSHGR